jgi:hypothetical protein
MKNTVLSLIRHALTFGGGFIAAKGFLSEDTVTTLAAAVPSFVGLVWGAVDEYLAEKKERALNR